LPLHFSWNINLLFMNLKEKISSINKEIQSFTVDNYNAMNDSLLNKLDELKTLMVNTYETNEGLNKYMVRIPMWLIDNNLVDFNSPSFNKDREFKDGVVKNCKKTTTQAIELFEHACIENSVNTLTQEGF
jgi:hypothetical protein